MLTRSSIYLPVYLSVCVRACVYDCVSMYCRKFCNDLASMLIMSQHDWTKLKHGKNVTQYSE
jgi:hypothetical protein